MLSVNNISIKLGEESNVHEIINPIYENQKFYILGLPGRSVVKNQIANAGDMGLIPVQKDPTCCRETTTVHHDSLACVLEPRKCNY